MPWWSVLQNNIEDCVSLRKSRQNLQWFGSWTFFQTGPYFADIQFSTRSNLSVSIMVLCTTKEKKSIIEIFPLCSLTPSLDARWIFRSIVFSINRKHFTSAQYVSQQRSSALLLPGSSQHQAWQPLPSCLCCLIRPCFTPPSSSSRLSPKGCTHLACLYCVINLTLHLGFIFWKFWMVSWKCCWTIGALWTQASWTGLLALQLTCRLWRSFSTLSSLFFTIFELSSNFIFGVGSAFLNIFIIILLFIMVMTISLSVGTPGWISPLSLNILGMTTLATTHSSSDSESLACSQERCKSFANWFKKRQ